VTSYTLDNRGEAQFTFSLGLDTKTLTRFVASIYTGGADNLLGTADDVRMRTSVSYRKGILSLNAATALNQRYRVILKGTYIKDIAGRFIDGEFNGVGSPSGNGVAGGDLDVMTTAPAKTRVRYTTPQGPIVVSLYKNTPNMKANFVGYANSGKWDNVIMHRAAKKSPQSLIDIVQGGGFRMNRKANTTTKLTEDHGDVANEGTNQNLAGTLAMANAGPGTNNLEWFFNVTNNPFLDQTPGQYTVFGAVEKASLRSMKALLNYETSGTTALPLGAETRTDVPIVSIPAINARGSISPKDDYVYFPRVAVLNDVVATAVTPAAKPARAVPTLMSNASAVSSVVPTPAVFAVKTAIAPDEDLFA
jgi:cyclophilin family peptidyl-prolyl cis-trans isomerase